MIFKIQFETEKLSISNIFLQFKKVSKLIYLNIVFQPFQKSKQFRTLKFFQNRSKTLACLKTYKTSFKTFRRDIERNTIFSKP